MTIPTYRDRVLSGLPMVGDVPRHWRKTALKYLGEYQNGYPFKPEDWGDVGLPIVRIAQLSGQREPNYFDGTLDEGFRIKDGDLLFSWSATIDSFIWTGGDAWLNQHIFKVTASEEAEKAFLFYVIKHVAPKLADFDAHGSTMRHIKKESLGERLFVPTRPEQRAIATFLDRETAKIDALVEDQKRLIELLKEKRQAVISQAVTKGLDPSVPMKDSGVEWMGKVPAHWEVKAIKWLSPVFRGASPRPIDDPKYFDEDGEYAWVRIADASASKGVLLETTQRLSELGSSLSVKLEPGALFVSIAGTVGKPCIAGIQCCIHDGFVYFPRLRIDPQFLFRLFELGACYAGLGKMGTQLNLNTDTIGSIKIGLPPPRELSAILGFVDLQTRQFDELIVEAQEAVTLLQERRSALISAAVTGKIDVRGLAPQ
jgi:type I restriction enzyme S subunit